MDKKFVSLMMVFFLAFLLFVILAVFNGQIANFARAKEDSMPSSETSLIFAWPLTTLADNKTAVEVNIFIRNSNNMPLPDKKVQLTSSLGILSNDVLTTDKSGKATFFLKSGTPGLAELTTLVESQVQLKQKISIKFE